MANICLVAVLGTGILCSGGGGKTVTDSGCQVFGPDIARLSRFTDAELAALSRAKKEAIATLRRNKAKLCK